MIILKESYINYETRVQSGPVALSTLDSVCVFIKFVCVFIGESEQI